MYSDSRMVSPCNSPTQCPSAFWRRPRAPAARSREFWRAASGRGGRSLGVGEVSPFTGILSDILGARSAPRGRKGPEAPVLYRRRVKIGKTTFSLPSPPLRGRGEKDRRVSRACPGG